MTGSLEIINNGKLKIEYFEGRYKLSKLNYNTWNFMWLDFDEVVALVSEMSDHIKERLKEHAEEFNLEYNEHSELSVSIEDIFPKARMEEMDKIRGFEVAKGFEDKNINLPKRATKFSAGYDFEVAEDITVPPLFNTLFDTLDLAEFVEEHKGDCTDEEYVRYGVVKTDIQKQSKPTLIPTGVKAYMQEDEYLQLVMRSSMPLKRGLVLANSVGVIDSDYYNNPDNDGHIMFQVLNTTNFPVNLTKGERIGQGIFHKFLTVDGDVADGERKSGFGSTGGK